jgi:hypothetical protein
MRFTRLAWFPGGLAGRRTPLPGGRSARWGGPLRRWLRQADAALVTAARVSEPVALLLLIVTGFALPWLRGDLAPIPAARTLHGLAGLALVLVLLYRVAALGGRGLLGLVRAIRPQREAPLPSGAWGALGQWRGWRNGAIQLAYTVTLAALVFSGVERWWTARASVGGHPGATLLPLLSAAQAQALHALAAPYFCAALLILFYVKGRKRARALLDELRSP